ncbi:sulfite exporter TauE/SafE family protein [Rhizobium sp. KVB221]|uniref:Probable membrane transporter protein n=1 Tax=Rhizobium setariae TaxID=2801340 RepID=A0A937CR48_9HYPH|nr:sulfite exporter TauE/SafE family protein [Rhizobium setariae]MBL0374873.1 sulfite exporter TauE/SafE family protein [Rhizobium setariae]
MPPFQELAVFALALIAAGAVAGLLAGLFGVGGGAILVPVFYQVYGLFGVPEAVRTHVAVGTSLAIIVPTSIRSFHAHWKRGAVDMDILRNWTIWVPLGTICAPVIAAYIAGRELRIIFAVLSLLIAIRMFLNRQHWRLGDDVPKGVANTAAGFGIGLFSGLMGIGGGVMSNLWMTLFGKTVHQSVATSSGVGVLISIPGLIGYIWAGWGASGLPPFSTGFVNWITVALVMPLTLYVAPYGVRLAHSLSRRQLEIGFGLFLTAVSIRFFVSLS